MKAFVLHAVNDLRYEDALLPSVKDGWALVKVRTAGICSSDIPRIYTKGTYHFPTIPGHEFSGIVEDTASDCDKHWIGKHVGVFPLIPCMECPQCKKHSYETCVNYDYIGSRRDGAFAEYVAVPCWNLIELPENISFTHAAMLEPLSVALHAVKKADGVDGKTVAVIGTGMIGFSVAQWARGLGASSVTIIGRSEEKRTIADQLKLNYIAQENETIGTAYDVVIEATGFNPSINKSIEIAEPSGIVVLMGNPAGDISFSQKMYWQILRKQLSVKGTWNSSYESSEICDWSRTVDAIKINAISLDPLISHIFSKEKLPEGLEIMKNRTESYCKIITLWNE